MQNIQFPVQFIFKITTLANDFTAIDASGKEVAYVRSKLFKFKEDVQVFNDNTKSKVNYTIKADRWIDFSAAYKFTDSNGAPIGKIARKGWRSLWKAEYTIIDQNDKEQYKINEDNALVKIIDSMIGEIPVLGMFTGYFFNPSYTVSNLAGKPIARLKKNKSFWGRKFELEQLGEMDNDDDDRVMLGVMMMLLLERKRG